MPIARVRLPDGRVARLDVVEGTTPEQIESFVSQQLQQTPQQPVVQEERPQLVSGPLEAGLVAAGRGLTTLARGVGLAEPEDPVVTRAFERTSERFPVATTVGEIAGEAAPFLVPGAAISSIGSNALRILASGALGASEGGLIAAGRGEDIEGISKTAGISGIAAGTLEAIFPHVSRLGGALVRRVTGKAPSQPIINAAGEPSDELVQSLEAEGLTLEVLGRDARKLVEQQPETVDAGLLAQFARQTEREQLLRAQGLEPTPAQVTREADKFQAQQEAAKTSGRVREALEKQDRILSDKFDDIVVDSSGQPVTSGSLIVDAITNKSVEVDQVISGLYRQARDQSQGAKNVRLNEFVSSLKRNAPSNEITKGLIKSIKGELQSRGIIDEQFKIIGRVGVDTAEEIRKFINSQFNSTSDFGRGLSRKLKDSLDADVLKTAGEDVFRQARRAKAVFESDLSRARVSKFDTNKKSLVRDIVENKIDPDQLFDKAVLGKGTRASDLNQVKEFLQSGTDEQVQAGMQAWNDLRAESLQFIKDTTFTGPADEAGFQALSRAGLEKAMNRIGKEKAAVLFTPAERSFLRDMVEVSKIREPVRGTALGRGPSAQAVQSLENTLRKLPVLGEFVIDNMDISGRQALKLQNKAKALAKSAAENRRKRLSGARAAFESLPSVGGAAAAAAATSEDQ